MAALLCLENPLLDIQAFGDKTLLEKYGLQPNDAILADDRHMALYDDLINNHSAQTAAGGGAQNTARGAQYLLPPSSVLYIGCVGRDKYADFLTSACRAAGVQVEYRIDDEQPTGRCGVIITDHNRSMCTNLGAANHYRIEHLMQARIWQMVEAARFYFVGGYHLTVCPEAVMALAEEAAAKNKVFMMSLSAPFIPLAFKDALDKTTPFWDYIVGNDSEAIAWAEAHNLETRDIPTVAQHIASLPKVNKEKPRIVIVTQGSAPTIVTVSDTTGYKSIPVRKVSADEIVDTTGAGDAFAGGFLAGVVQEKPLETCIDMGHWLAHTSIKELGPNYPYPKQEYRSL